MEGKLHIYSAGNKLLLWGLTFCVSTAGRRELRGSKRTGLGEVCAY